MKRFTQLFCELDRTTRTNEKVEALERYFREAPPQDAVWGLQFLSGRKIPRAISSTLMRDWGAEEAKIPVWLLDECFDAVGDLAETLALVQPDKATSTKVSLYDLVTNYLLPLGAAHVSEKREILLSAWRMLNSQERLVWNKLITGSFRVGVARTLVIRALARVAGIPQPVMAHRVLGNWSPTAEDFSRILSGEVPESEPAKPYPFFLASPLQENPETLGDVKEWLGEWKWDGIRAQLIRREGKVFLWSRGDEMITHSFPEISESAKILPEGVVLDGEILAWENDKPLPFSVLQKRLNRKSTDYFVRNESPVVFLAYDLLEHGGEDIRELPLHERRQRLETLISSASRLPLRVSPLIKCQSWEGMRKLKEQSREREVEGIMLKRLTSRYQVGRTRGDWWKWKIDPYFIDCVLIYAQRGSGRRASLYTDYTFGVWDNGQLTPFAKAYSGLTDEEIKEVDKFVRTHSIEKHGPVRVVEPRLVFELAFEAIQPSSRHRSGVAVRFPRMNRWRKDKKPEEADTIETVRGLLKPARKEKDYGSNLELDLT